MEQGTYISGLIPATVLGVVAPVLKTTPTQNIYVATTESVVPLGSVVAELWRH